MRNRLVRLPARRYNGRMERRFRLIEGGLKDKTEWRRYFISAYVTDTRLMGVLGMYIHWRAADNGQTADFHQFFYFDAEETGFETYLGLWSDDPQEVAEKERENCGGLGGKKINLTLTEARHILRHYLEFNRAHDLPMPPGKEEYLDLLKDLAPMTEEEAYWLLMKQCAPITSEYALIHYFLMRSFGKDLEAVSLLTDNGRRQEVYPACGIATMCRNAIREDHGLYHCDSLIEHGGQYEVVITKIRVTGMKIEKCETVSAMNISPQEAALILSRPEFITVYRIMDAGLFDLEDEEDYDTVTTGRLDAFTLDYDTMSDSYDTGRLFFTFYDNNTYVDRPVFLLSGDVRGVYYLTDMGQLLVMAYDLQAIHELEKQLDTEGCGLPLFLTDRFEFKEPILYEFIQSGYDDFNDFVEVIKEDE